MSSIVPPIAPTMALNFEQCRSNADAAAMIKRYGLTFGRASGATYIDRRSKLVLAASNEVRLAFDGSGENKGLLIEGSVANLATAYTLTAGGFTSQTVNNELSATNFMLTCVENTASSARERFLNITTALPYAISCIYKNLPANRYVKLLGSTVGASTYTGATFDSAGVIVSETVANSARVTSLGDGYFLAEVTVTPADGAAHGTFVRVTDTTSPLPSTGATFTGTGLTYIFGAVQLAIGNVASSRIFVNGASATRAADSLSGASLSALIGQSELNIFAKVDTRNYNPGTARVIADLYEDASNYIRLQKTTGNAFELVVVAAGSTVAQITDPTGSRAGVFQVGARVKANDFQLLVNGSSVGTDVAGAVPAVSKIGVGHAIDASLNASLWFGDRIGKLYLFNRALTAAVNQNITRNI